MEANLTPTAKPTSLRLLTQAAKELREAQEALESNVRNARRCGASWAEVAGIVGITRQAAQQKYGKTPAPARNTSRDHLYTDAENREADAALAALQGVAEKQDEYGTEPVELPSKKVDAPAPAKPLMAKGMSKKGKTPALDSMTLSRTEWSILDSPFGWQVTVPEGAQPGTGKGPHACPSCGSTNHKGATNHRLEFNTDCSPTKYDPPYIAKFMRLVAKAK